MSVDERGRELMLTLRIVVSEGCVCLFVCVVWFGCLGFLVCFLFVGFFCLFVLKVFLLAV